MPKNQLKNKTTEFLKSLINMSGLTESDNPMTKVLMGQLGKILMVISSDSTNEQKVKDLLNYIKENWNDE